MAKWAARGAAVAGLAVAALGAVACGSDDEGAPAAVTDQPVGTACSSDANCGGYAIAACVTAIMPLEGRITDPNHPGADALREFGLPFPGGYCSNTIDNGCSADADCGPGGACFIPFEGVSQATIDDLAGLGLPFDMNQFASLGICMKPCTANSDCRQGEGYECLVPIDGFLDVINPNYVKTFCTQFVDVTPLLQG